MGVLRTHANWVITENQFYWFYWKKKKTKKKKQGMTQKKTKILTEIQLSTKEFTFYRILYQMLQEKERK